MTGPVLVPVALSGSTAGRLSVVEQQARAMEAEVLLLHVLRGGAAVAEQGLVPAAEAMARTHLDAMAFAMRRRGVRARTLVGRGRVGTSVRDAAAEHRASLIIVGSSPRRLGPLPLRAWGSRGRAEEIALHAPCPVLVVRPEEEVGVGRVEEVLRDLGSSPLRLFDDDAALAGALAPHATGTRTVELSRVVGTVAAVRLGQDFRPLRRTREESERHAQLTKLMAERPERLALPELYKLGYGYYVFSGHAHVAAARAVGHAWIDASVTEYVPVADEEAGRVLAERLAFERETGISGVGAALPGTYGVLRALVAEFAQGDPLTLAAPRWKAAIFRPLQRRPRELRVNQRFPGERSADIVARIAAHREGEARRRGREVYWEEALASFVASTGFARSAA